MLRALSNYFFGSYDDQKSSEFVECETKEVKDWLVVNMPDHQDEDIDLEDADTTETMDDDDILSSLSVLMAPGIEPAPEDIDSLSSRRRDWELTERIYLEKQQKGEYSFVLDPAFVSVLYANPKSDLLPSCFERSLTPFDPVGFAKDFIMGGLVESHNRAVRHGKKPHKDCFLLLSAADKGSARSPKGKEAGEELALKAKKDVTCHPAFTTHFCNHRHLSFPSKPDALERVKELEPEQKAKDQALKKHITRGQLNRQNKNYVYEKSSKRNRRSNLQRKPSGANNNRKC